MKRSLRIAIALIAIFVVISCQKQAAPELLVDPDEASVNELVELATSRYMSGVVFLSAQGLLSVPDDGLIDEFTVDEEALVAGRPNRLLICLRSVEPLEEQFLKIRRALHAYQFRNSGIIANHRQALSKLHKHMEELRQDLMLQYQDGKFTEQEYRRRLYFLRERYQEALTRIRENHATAFARSYRMLLGNLNTILDQEQWMAFSSCMLSEPVNQPR